MKNKNEIYNEKYFTTNNYTNYLHRIDRYKKTAKEIKMLFDSLSLTTENSFIIDYGCAIGQFIEGLISAGYKNVVGIDISTWARNYSLQKGLKVFDINYDPKTKIDVMFALDVFEHMYNEEIYYTLNKFSPKILVVRIPVALKKGESFYLKISRQDKTHINCKTKKEWETFITSLGYTIIFKLNLISIFDGEGVFCAMCLKETYEK